MWGPNWLCERGNKDVIGHSVVRTDNFELGLYVIEIVWLYVVYNKNYSLLEWYDYDLQKAQKLKNGPKIPSDTLASMLFY